MKRIAVVFGLSMLAWTMLALAGIGALFVYDRVANPQEDSDLMANCWFYGDGQCGPNASWHGFVNFR